MKFNLKKRTLIGFLLVVLLVAFFVTRHISNPFDPDADWTPELPKHILTHIEEVYGDNEDNKRAVLQRAHALWMTLDPEQDFETTSARVERARYCIFYRNLNSADMIDFERKLFYNSKLTRKYLEWDSQHPGGIYEQRDSSEADCD